MCHAAIELRLLVLWPGLSLVWFASPNTSYDYVNVTIIMEKHVAM